MTEASESDTQSSRPHDVIWQDIKQTAIHLLETDDTASVFSKHRVLDTLRRKVNATGDRKAESLVEHRQQGDISRRKFLKLLGFGAAGVTVSAGIGRFMGQRIFDESPQITGYITVDGMSFDNVVKADEVGMDTNGNSPIDGQFADAAGDNTLIEFPPGTYRVNRLVNQDYQNFGFRGTGDSPDAVRFVAGDGAVFMFEFEGRDLLFKNYSIDQGTDWNRLYKVVFAPSGGQLKVIDHHLLGTEPTEPSLNAKQGDSNVGNHIGLNNNGADVTIDGFTKVGPTQYMGYPRNRSLLWTGKGSSGTLTLRNWYIENGSGSTFYGGKGDTKILVENSFFKNALDKSIRVGGREDRVINCTFIMDHNNWHADNEVVSGGKGRNATGIWMQTQVRNFAGPTIENCDFLWKSIHSQWSSRGMIATEDDTGGCIVKNCRFTNDTGAPAIRAESPSSNAGTPHKLEITGCHFTGSGSGAAVQVNGRSGSTMADCCINMPNGGDVSGVQTTNVNRGGSCKEADPSSPVGAPSHSTNAPSQSPGSDSSSKSSKKPC